MTAAANPPDQDSAAHQTELEPAICLRCRVPAPVNDDGFCDRCEKALEQACL